MVNKLKSQKGITLISLIVYVIVMLVVITIVGTVTSYFYTNVNKQYQDSKDENGEATLDMYLTNDLKNKEIIIGTVTDAEEFTEIPQEGSKNIILKYKDNTSIIYTITNKGIYRNAVKIYNIENDNMIFSLGDPISSTSNNVIYEKQELRLEKIVAGQDENEIFKSYIVNIETKVVYPTN